MKIRAYGWALGLALAGLFLVGCGDDDDCIGPDRSAPGIPRGVFTVTGDYLVTVYWLGSSEDDLDGYDVWRSDNAIGPYEVLATIDAGAWDPEMPDFYYEDRDVVNGEKWYYAVSAFDFAGNESDLSLEIVYDVPRPEGFNVYIDSRDADNAFDFSGQRKVQSSSAAADIIVVYDTQLDALFVESADIDDVEMQDFGYTDFLDDLDFAPEDGWSGVGWSELIEGHSYVVRTTEVDGSHYAKFRVTDMGARWIRIDWAYQEVEGERQFKPAVPTDTATVSAAQEGE